MTPTLHRLQTSYPIPGGWVVARRGWFDVWEVHTIRHDQPSQLYSRHYHRADADRHAQRVAAAHNNPRPASRKTAGATR